MRRRIETARAYGGFKSQEALAKRIGMTKQPFLERLRGKIPWRRGDILAIAEACQVPVWFLEEGWDVEVTSPGTGDPSVDLGLSLEEDSDDREDEHGHG